MVHVGTWLAMSLQKLHPDSKLHHSLSDIVPSSTRDSTRSRSGFFFPIDLRILSHNFPMNDKPPSEAELQFYYFGLYQVLQRYRIGTTLAWLIVSLGVVSIPLGWKLGTPHGLIDIALSVGTILAGLLVVQQNVATLSSYLNVPFGSRITNESHERSLVVDEIEALMKEVESGGWQEAYSAIGKLKNLEAKYGLPRLDS